MKTADESNLFSLSIRDHLQEKGPQSIQVEKLDFEIPTENSLRRFSDHIASCLVSISVPV